ncbi:MAG: undecaprenyl/decaprenyl-phosphate alpha-N-acetylglucosaminyl 1-phosphate transferase [Arenimonas sp.]|uniref:MraY family glycosyltransferase n=1 Tax=Arenimonas sp. TaxID=1872635 RepID=UPI0025C0D4EF|nr:MraY family glycosyltransferase [Arenimonas sp.]MBW8367932.1 undecaprenyl/decaprenyl-phosphate alpha-N-acetylglucosaminyl 1-phosphate transferase [Arenimonas sp.]
MGYTDIFQQLDALAWQRIGFCLALSVLALPLMLPLARRFGLVDHPGGRKDHGCAMPVIGGLVIYGVVVAAFLLFESDVSLRTWVFIAGAGLLVLVGQLDDYFDLRWTWRIGAQSLAALMMALVGGLVATNLQDVFGFTGANMGWLAVPFTVFIVVGVINALNMADGVDGLAGSLSVVALVLYACFGLYAGDALVAERALAVAAAVLGFLVWNARLPWQPRARVFLGNGGSMLLGFTIAYFSVRLSHGVEHPVSPVLGPWALSLPLIDCVALMIRRWREGRSPFAADRQHMHHMLLDAGFRASAVVAIIAGGSLVLGVAAAVAVKLGVYRPLVVLAFLAMLAGWYVFSCDYPRAVARLARWRNARSPGPSVDATESQAH